MTRSSHLREGPPYLDRLRITLQDPHSLGLPVRCAATEGNAAPTGGLAGATTTPAEVAAIRSADLTKRHGRLTALSHVSLSVPSGSVFGLLGPNGAGKSTFVRIVVGLMRPTSGSCWVAGRSAGDPRSRTGLGYVPEAFRHPESYTVAEVCTLHAALAGVPRAARRRAVEEALASVGLAQRADTRVGTLSKGMQQRLSLAAALVGHPLLLVLDEPTSALDPIGRAEIRALIKHLRQQGTTVFLSSHLLAAVEQTCTHVAVLDHGNVVMQGAIADLVSGTTARLRVTGLTRDQERSLSKYGPVDGGTDGWLTITQLARDDVAVLVAEIGRLGGSVHDIVQRHETLEDRFLDVVRGA